MPNPTTHLIHVEDRPPPDGISTRPSMVLTKQKASIKSSVFREPFLLPSDLVAERPLTLTPTARPHDEHRLSGSWCDRHDASRRSTWVLPRFQNVHSLKHGDNTSGEPTDLPVRRIPPHQILGSIVPALYPGHFARLGGRGSNPDQGRCGRRGRRDLRLRDVDYAGHVACGYWLQ